MDNSKSVSVESVKTNVFHLGDDLFQFLKENLKGKDLEGKVIAITSKIISLAEKRTVNKTEIAKLDLIKREADVYIGPGGYGAELTIKHGILIPSSGIDESNAEEDFYILFPEKPYESAKKIWNFLKKEFKLKNCAVILTDSHTTPLRRGVTGISLAHWGFKATRSLIGKGDLFGRELKFTHVDLVDAMASMAVLIMGEADDSVPLALISGVKLEYSEVSSGEEIKMDPKNDLYHPLLKNFT
jgi:dihydrofolate synthase / folylpolyglutamate synthase